MGIIKMEWNCADEIEFNSVDEVLVFVHDKDRLFDWGFEVSSDILTYDDDADAPFFEAALDKGLNISGEVYNAVKNALDGLEYTEEQEDEIFDLLYDETREQVRGCDWEVDTRDLSEKQTDALVDAYRKDIDTEQLEMLANPNYTAEQIEAATTVLDDGEISAETVKQWLKSGISAEEMQKKALDMQFDNEEEGDEDVVVSPKELFDIVIETNSPVDWKWVSHIRNTFDVLSRRRWAIEQVRNVAPKRCSKQVIVDAAIALQGYLDLD